MPELTNVVTVAQAQRIGAAFGKHLGLVDAQGQPRSATLAEVNEERARQLRQFVLHVERQTVAINDLGDIG